MFNVVNEEEMNCKTCGKETKNKTYCSKKCQVLFPHSYDNESYCRLCAQWQEKDIIFCKNCNNRVSHSKRYHKDPNRWLKAY